MCADSARDALARHRQRGRLRERGSERADDAVLEDHAARIARRPRRRQEAAGASGASRAARDSQPAGRRFDLASEHVRVLLHDCFGERVTGRQHVLVCLADKGTTPRNRPLAYASSALFSCMTWVVTPSWSLSGISASRGSRKGADGDQVRRRRPARRPPPRPGPPCSRRRTGCGRARGWGRRELLGGFVPVDGADRLGELDRVRVEGGGGRLEVRGAVEALLRGGDGEERVLAEEESSVTRGSAAALIVSASAMAMCVVVWVAAAPMGRRCRRSRRTRQARGRARADGEQGEERSEFHRHSWSV